MKCPNDFCGGTVVTHQKTTDDGQVMDEVGICQECGEEVLFGE